MNKRAVLIVLGALLLVAIGTLGWLNSQPVTDSPGVMNAGAVLPIPPLPPRLPETERYDRCLSQVSEDPSRAVAEADSWWRETGEVAAALVQASDLLQSPLPCAGAAWAWPGCRRGGIAGSAGDSCYRA